MSVDIDELSARLSELPNDHPSKVIGAVAVNGMWFIRYVAELDPDLYRRARSYAIDCTRIAGVVVEEANGTTKIGLDEDQSPEDAY